MYIIRFEKLMKKCLKIISELFRDKEYKSYFLKIRFINF